MYGTIIFCLGFSVSTRAIDHSFFGFQQLLQKNLMLKIIYHTVLVLNFGFLAKVLMINWKKDSSEISSSVEQWKKFDWQLCALLWQSNEPNILGTLKTCKSFWKKA